MKPPFMISREAKETATVLSGIIVSVLSGAIDFPGAKDTLGASLARGARGDSRQVSSRAARVVFDAIWHAIEENATEHVRIPVIGVLLQVASAVGEELAMACAWPQILVLSNDVENVSRAAAIVGMCSFATLVSSTSTLDKVFAAIFALLDTDGVLSETLVIVLGALRERVNTTPSHAREAHVIPLVVKATRLLGSPADSARIPPEQRRRIVAAIVDFLSGLLLCPALTYAQVRQELMPLLKVLQKEMDATGAEISVKQQLAVVSRELSARETRLKPYSAEGMSFFDKVKHELNNIVKH